MNQRRIAIACQGGGSQCAFVAGALETLLVPEVTSRYQIVGLSGTSGGALTAAVGWLGLLRQARGDATPIADRIAACWRDLTAQTPMEIAFDAYCTQLLRFTENGYLPTLATSPSSPLFYWSTALLARMFGRPEFTDLRALLLAHIDFDALPGLIQPESPVLLVGAGDVLEGTFKIFSSALGEIKVESILASAAIPTLFPAVWADGHAYWDGIFASNPPIFGFLQEKLMGRTDCPHEIWVIVVNRVRRDTVPERPGDVTDRRNQLAGNLSGRHELQLIEMINTLLREGALTDQFRARFGLDTSQTVTVRFIRMSDELAESLDYPSKLSRQPRHIERLRAEGRAQATKFLSELDTDRSIEVNGDGRAPRSRPSGATGRAS